MTASLAAAGLSHWFGDRAVVSDVTLEISPGEVVCLLGPSGCGKTTTLRLVAGLEVVQRGEIRLSGNLVATPSLHTPPEERGVGLVFQDFALFPHLTIAENVAFGLPRSHPDRRRRSLSLLERVGLADRADQYPHTLSGGEQQRVALVRALAPEPRLMLMDEPFSGLDVRLRDQVREETVALLAASGTGALLVTHDPEEAMRVADRIAVMREGRIVQIGSADALYDHPLDGQIARFFSELNGTTGVVRAGRLVVPWGAMTAEDGLEGMKVEVLVRPEAVGIVSAGDGTVGAQVLAIRSIGPGRLVRLQIDGMAEPWLVRVPNRIALAPGQRVGIVIDPSGTHVFRAPEASLPQ